MSGHPRAIRLGAWLLALSLASLPAAHADVAKVGIVSRVQNVAFSTVPGTDRVRVRYYDDVVRNELVETEADAAVRIHFIDGAELAMGANSELLIDEFVYDPARGEETAILSLAHGVLRFVSGSMADAGVRLLTPSATIGIRGSEGVIRSARLDALSGPARALAETSLGRALRAMPPDTELTLLQVEHGAFTIGPPYGARRSVTAGHAVAALPDRVGRVVRHGTDGLAPDPAPHRTGQPAPHPRRAREPPVSGAASAERRDADTGSSCVTVAEYTGRSRDNGLSYRRLCTAPAGE